MKTPVRFEEALGVACMAVLVAITLGNVVTRYLTDESFAWTEEISIFLLVVMTLAGAASIAARDGHIRLEFFYDAGSARRRRAEHTTFPGRGRGLASVRENARRVIGNDRYHRSRRPR